MCARGAAVHTAVVCSQTLRHFGILVATKNFDYFLYSPFLSSFNNIFYSRSIFCIHSKKFNGLGKILFLSYNTIDCV